MSCSELPSTILFVDTYTRLRSNTHQLTLRIFTKTPSPTQQWQSEYILSVCLSLSASLSEIGMDCSLRPGARSQNLYQVVPVSSQFTQRRVPK